MTHLTVTRTLLDLATSTDEGATFSSDVEEVGHPTLTVQMDAARYADLGSPTELTVTIEPGDHLNP